MNKVIFFESNGGHVECLCGNNYNDFIDYAFSRTDYFMLVYVNYYGKGYSKNSKIIRRELEPYKIKSRSNASWPGTLKTSSPNTKYKIIFYKNNDNAKETLKKASSLSYWSRPSNPEDLAFFKGNQCWFYSVGHEKIAAILNANEEDLRFVESKGISYYTKPYTNYFDNYNTEDG